MDNTSTQFRPLTPPFRNVYDSSVNQVETVQDFLEKKNISVLIYKVKAGDTLSGIIAKRYSITQSDSRYHTAIATVMYFNPSIKHQDEIFAGQLLRLCELGADTKIQKPPEASGTTGETQTAEKLASAKAFQQSRREELARTMTHHGSDRRSNQRTIDFHRPMSPQEEEAMWTIAWLTENYYTPGSIAAGAGLNTFGALVSPAHNQYLRDMKDAFDMRGEGQIHRNQYRKRMKAARLAYINKIGPFDKLLFKGQTITDATYIRNTRALPATTVHIENHLSRLEKMGRLASRGGIVLTVAGVGMGCHSIGSAQTRQEKNEIFVETVAGTLAGVGSSVALGVFFFTTPAGWATALVLGAAAAVGSWGAGRGFSELYTISGSKFDAVSITGIDKICR